MEIDWRWTGPRQPWESPDPAIYNVIRQYMAINVAKTRFDYSMNNLLRHTREVNESSDPQEAKKTADAFCNNVEKISEPLRAIKIPKCFDHGMSAYIKAARDERNRSVHVVRDVYDYARPFDEAVHSLTTDLNYVFEHFYPKVQRSLEAEILKQTKKSMSEALGRQRLEHKKYLRKVAEKAKKAGDESKKADGMYTIDDLPDFLTYVTGVDENSPVVMGKIRTDAKFSRKESPVADAILQALQLESTISSSAELAIEGKSPDPENLFSALQKLQDKEYLVFERKPVRTYFLTSKGFQIAAAEMLPRRILQLLSKSSQNCTQISALRVCLAAKSAYIVIEISPCAINVDAAIQSLASQNMVVRDLKQGTVTLMPSKPVSRKPPCDWEEIVSIVRDGWLECPKTVKRMKNTKLLVQNRVPVYTIVRGQKFNTWLDSQQST